MKKILIALLSVVCTAGYSQKVTVVPPQKGMIVELPLTTHVGYDHFSPAIGALSDTPPASEDGVWAKTRLQISKMPEGLTDVKWGEIETNIYQNIYQKYLAGNITKETYESVQDSWNWTPDTTMLSKAPVRTKVAYAYGKDLSGNTIMVVDVNGNLDLTDDRRFVPAEMNMTYWLNPDSMLRQNVIEASVEVFAGNKIVSVNVPLLIMYHPEMKLFMNNIAQYATTDFMDEQIAVAQSNFNSLSYNGISVAKISEGTVGNGRYNIIYNDNNYIELSDWIWRIVGVNTNRNVLVLENAGNSKDELVVNQPGFKAPAFEGKEFTTGADISLEGLKGKYVLLDFWGTWCGPCIADIPSIKTLYDQTDRNKLEIVGIAHQSAPAAITKAIGEHGISWPQIVSSADNDIVGRYGVTGFPTKILIDPQGIVVSKIDFIEQVLELME